MIVKMKKLTLIFSERHHCEALQSLRQLGALHIKHMRRPSADYITSLEHKMFSADEALGIISNLSSHGERVELEDKIPIIKEVIALGNKKKQLQINLEEAKVRRLWYQEWGDIPFAKLEYLKKAGVFLRLYRCSKKAFKQIAKEKTICILNRKAGEIFFVLFSTDKDERLDIPEVALPKEEKSHLDKKIKVYSNNLAETEADLAELSVYKSELLDYKKDLAKRLDFCKARFGMASDEGIRVLQGFCPREVVGDIEALAAKEGWGLTIQEPESIQEVPTLIRNPKWVRIIKPVFDFMGTLPGYKEYDISFWFLLFFSLFFAMIIGDAGYGFVFLGATIFAHKKFRSLQKEPFFLMYVLSCATIIWGAITGTWFGFEGATQLPLINALIISKINTFIDSNQVFIIYLCFLIGAIQLTIAHSVVAFRYINSLVALGQIGWIFIIWVAFFLAGNLVLNKPMPGFVPALGAVGAGLVILFSHPQKNILKGIAAALIDFPLSAISSFSDIVSYLRLFAVGYATVAVATTFNNMAIGPGINSFLAGIIAAVILFLGHSLNIVLGLMSVVVHGIRLNMLEFSGHLSMQWSGNEYKPFKE